MVGTSPSLQAHGWTPKKGEDAWVLQLLAMAERLIEFKTKFLVMDNYEQVGPRYNHIIVWQTQSSPLHLALFLACWYEQGFGQCPILWGTYPILKRERGS